MLQRSEYLPIPLLVEVARLRVLLASTSMLAFPTYQALKDTNHELLGLIIKDERPSGRGLEKSESVIARNLGDDGLPIYRVKRHEELYALLSELEVDLVIAISFGMLIRADSLKKPKHGWINLHFSLLPKYRGAAPVQRAILAGEERTGISIFRLDEGMDTGPIFRQKAFPIAGRNAGELLDFLSREGASEVISTLDLIERGDIPSPQIGEPSLAPKIGTLEARIDFATSAESITRKIAAFSPTPGAWCEFRGRRIKIFSAKPSILSGDESGVCISVNPLILSCGAQAVEIEEMQEAGKRRMTAQEWVRGVRLDLGARFS